MALTRGMADSTIAAPATANETILVAQLDWLWPHVGGGSTIQGIKIDVQGMELEALQGMAETLRTSRPKLVLELHIRSRTNCAARYAS